MDSLGPLIGPVVPPAETTRPMRVRSERVSSSSSNRLGPSSLLSFGADARTRSCMALVTRALSTLSSAVLRCWCLTGPQQPPIGGCESLSLFLLEKGLGIEKEDSGIRSIVAGIVRSLEIILRVGNLFMGTR